MPIKKYDAGDAWKTFKGNKLAWWPSRTKQSERIMPIASPGISDEISLTVGEKVFTIGSCFARNIEEHLSKLGFEVPCSHFSVPKAEWKHRPNGVLNKYNPYSMLYEIQWATGHLDFPFKDGFMDVGEGQYLDFQLPRGVVPATYERAVARRKEIQNLFREITTSQKLVLTLGLVEAWWDNHLNLYLNSTVPHEIALKHPGRFELHVLSYQEVLKTVLDLVDHVSVCAPQIDQIVVTVSPVPLTATFTGTDVLVANTYSKSVLRAVCEEVRAARSVVRYFPSYESVILSDRDVTWMDDLIHVTDNVVGKNVERLSGFLKPR